MLWNAIDKLSEPWAIYEIIAKLLGLLSGSAAPPPDSEPSPEKPYSKPSDGRRRRSSTKSPAPISEKPPLPPPSPPPTPPTPPTPTYAPLLIPPALDTLLTLASRGLGLLRTFFVSLLHTVHTPAVPPPRTKPVLRMSIFRLASTFLQLPLLQPWLLGNLQLLSRPFTTRSTPPGAVLDALLSSAIHARLSDPALAAAVLQVAREALFAPPRPQPCPTKVRAAAEDALVAAVPARIRTLWFGTAETDALRERVGERYLEVWADREVNRHLLYQVLDLVVARVAPELVEMGPAEVRRGRVRRGV